MRARPEMVPVIVPSRYAHPLLVQLADTLAQMLEVKHADREGIPVQRGIEY